MNNKGRLYTIISAILFGVTPALASYTYTLGSNAPTLTFYRNLLVIPIILAIMLVKKISFKITLKEFGQIALLGIMGRGITTLTLYAAYDYIGTSVATTLHFLYPIFVAMICFFLCKEKLSKPMLIALTAASFGIFLFFEKGGSTGMVGVGLAVFSAVTYGFYMFGLDKTGLKNMHPMKLSFYMASVVSLGMLGYNIPTGAVVFQLSPMALLYTGIVAICTSLVAVSLLQMGIKHLSATMAAIYSLFEPVTSFFMGVLFLGEALSIPRIVGSVIILLAVTYLSIVGKSDKESQINVSQNQEIA